MLLSFWNIDCCLIMITEVIRHYSNFVCSLAPCDRNEYIKVLWLIGFSMWVLPFHLLILCCVWPLCRNCSCVAYPSEEWEIADSTLQFWYPFFFSLVFSDSCVSISYSNIVKEMQPLSNVGQLFQLASIGGCYSYDLLCYRTAVISDEYIARADLMLKVWKLGRYIEYNPIILANSSSCLIH